MKKRLLLLSLMVVMGNLSMGENFKEGTYLGSANGYKGEIKVEVKLSKDKIEDVKVISNTDTPIISEAPANIIPKKVLQTQGLGVDTVAGATGTSRGIIAAINNAIKSSGYKKDLRRVKEIKEKFTDKVIEHKDDVVVIGAGGAGLIAAIEAKLNGANVTVIEKMAFPGGNTLISGAEYAAPENWVQKKEGLKDS
ncbi:MAG: FAD-dependent oxidoreductase, partial [Cetobacterium sp.]